MTNSNQLSPGELKEEGNIKFKCGQFHEAIRCYTRALDEASTKEDRLILFKNRAACHLKLEKFSAALEDATHALKISSSDTKALFRRVQALEKLGQVQTAYNDARRLAQIDSNNTAVWQICSRLRAALEVKMMEERSTEKQVNSMLQILFDSSSQQEKRHKAANNLLVLVRDEDGAERIFREAGPPALAHLLLDERDHVVRAHALRTLSALCTGHQTRALMILREVTVEKICKCMAEHDHDISMMSFQLLQSIVDSLQGEEKKEFRRKGTDVVADYSRDLMEMMVQLKEMLVDGEVSAVGRDNAIVLLARNVPRSNLRFGTNARTIAFLDIGGVKNVMEVASNCYDVTNSPLRISQNTRLNCSVALSKMYDDLGGDKAREAWNEKIVQFVKSLFAGGDMTSNMRAMSLLTCLLQGPTDCGQHAIGLPGVLETMVAMTGSDAIDAQVVAVEAIITSTSKHAKAQFMVENGTSLLKELYKNSGSDAVRVRALVGLCKLGSSHGADISLRSFADGSTVKLGKQCKRFLSNAECDFDSRKWAAEGLSYLTLDADVKEDLCRDPVALKSLFELGKTRDKSVMYGVASCLVNCTNTYDSNGDKINPEMIELAKYSKQHIPEPHQKDGDEYVKARVNLLVEAGMVNSLVALANTDAAVQTDSSKELLCRVFRATVEDKKHRGLVVAAGGGKVLLPLASDGTLQGKRFAAQAVARIAITSDPRIAFPGQRSLECVRVLKLLLHPECDSLQNFESLMALTNLASLDDTHRRRIIREKMINEIESYMLEEHELLRRAATEVMCNMCMCHELREIMEREGHDRVKILTLFCAEEDEATRRAAAGALAMLTRDSEEISKRVRTQCQSWLDNLSIVSVDEHQDIAFRGLVIVHNVVTHCKFAAEDIVASNLLEVVMARSRDKSNAKLQAVSADILATLEQYGFIQATGL